MMLASRRARVTDNPCIVAMQKMLAQAPAGGKKPISLAQGIVHWSPPPQAVAEATAALSTSAVNQYGADGGDDDLKQALLEKLKVENEIMDSDVMITSGANQAFTNIVLACLDEDDSSVIFPPFYFNHHMALQMTGGASNVLMGEVDANFQPDVEGLRKLLEANPKKVKMIVVCTPCNPTGVIVPLEKIKAFQKLAEEHGSWLVVDNTYEHFRYDGSMQRCIEAPNVINIFSFSKAFGMMGWRMGYFTFPKNLSSDLLKIQDTIPICPPRISQRAALGALKAGRPWVLEQIAGLAANREQIVKALEPLGASNVFGGEGAIYYMAKLPKGTDDQQVVKFLAYKHGVVIIPGSACGSPGTIRVAFANLTPGPIFEEACTRLSGGLKEVMEGVDISTE